MNAATGDNEKRTRKPRAKQTGKMIGVRLQPDQLAAVNLWIAAQPEPRPSRPEAMRRLIEQALGW